MLNKFQYARLQIYSPWRSVLEYSSPFLTSVAIFIIIAFQHYCFAEKEKEAALKDELLKKKYSRARKKL